LLLVEALTGFVTRPAALHHLAHEIGWHKHITTLVVRHCLIEVLGD